MIDPRYRALLGVRFSTTTVPKLSTGKFLTCTLHTKRKVVEKSSNVLSTRQLYGCQPKSCQSRQHWQPKSSHHDNLVASKGCQNRHRQIDNLKVHIVVNMTPFWTLFDNLAFCVCRWDGTVGDPTPLICNSVLNNFNTYHSKSLVDPDSWSQEGVHPDYGNTLRPGCRCMDQLWVCNNCLHRRWMNPHILWWLEKRQSMFFI